MLVPALALYKAMGSQLVNTSQHVAIEIDRLRKFKKPLRNQGENVQLKALSLTGKYIRSAQTRWIV